MVGDISIAENIYIVCGRTDMRKSIDGLAAMVQSQYDLDPFSKSIVSVKPCAFKNEPGYVRL